MHLISLDLGTVTAWCAGDTGAVGREPRWGVWRLAGTSDLNRSFIGHYNELSDLLEAEQPGMLVYETPLSHSSRDRDRGTVDLHLGLAAITRLVAMQFAVQPYEQGFAQCRKVVLGKGTFAKPFRGLGKLSKDRRAIVGDAKEEVRLWAEEYGWRIDHPDARDAAVLFRYAQIISTPR